ncbi:hypothetical protein EAS17NKHM_025600 [Enterobacter asburiae]|uniref:hypothetical protein n=1 Tax=Enterobacter asburiae TaxID=61645 RepID=UPI0010CA4A7E|nr:hypothetical protein [Enterobacter asburiae]BBJ59164.1 hypothetical protein EAS17NKHM_025600 [Enterobacter asburiae]
MTLSAPDESAVELLATDLMKRIDKITGERHSVATLSSLRVSIVEACRAAMPQGAEQPQNAPQNIPENIPSTQFKPVADLYGLTSPTGGETSFTFDAVEARDFIDGGWSCQEYVDLERYQEAVSGNSPVIPEELLSAMEEVLRISDRDHDAWHRARAAIAKCRQQ